MISQQFQTNQCLIIDQSYRPLLLTYYTSSAEQQTQQNLIIALQSDSILSIHQSIILINKMIENKNVTIIAKLLTSGVLYRCIVFLTDEQNPQLCLQALRLIYNTCKYQSVRTYFMNQGFINRMVSIIKAHEIKYITYLAIITLQKFIKHHANEDSLQNFQWIKQIDKVSALQDSFIPQVIIKSLLTVCYNDLLFKYDDMQIFLRIIVNSLVYNHIQTKATMLRCLYLFRNNPQHFQKHFNEQNLDFVVRILKLIQNGQVSILALVLKGVLRLPLNKYNIRMLLIQNNILKILQPVINDNRQLYKQLYCFLIATLLNAAGQQQEQTLYFLSHPSIIQKLSLLVMTSSIKTVLLICNIFSSLCQCDHISVINFYRDSNIIQYYIKSIKKHKKSIALQALSDILRIMTYVEIRDFQLCEHFSCLIREQDIIQLEKIKFSSKQFNIKYLAMIKKLRQKYCIIKNDNVQL